MDSTHSLAKSLAISVIFASITLSVNGTLGKSSAIKFFSCSESVTITYLFREKKTATKCFIVSSMQKLVRIFIASCTFCKIYCINTRCVSGDISPEHMLGFLCDEEGTTMRSSSDVMTVVMTTNQNDLIGAGMMMAVRLGEKLNSLHLFFFKFPTRILQCLNLR